MSSLLPESELQQQFARRRMRQWILVIPMVIAVLAIRAAGDSGEPTFWGLPSSVVIAFGFVLILGAIAFSLYNWRCPSCAKYLGKGINPSFCPKCGFRLKP